MLAKSSYQGVLLGGKQYSEPLDCPPSNRSPTRRDTGILNVWPGIYSAASVSSVPNPRF